MALVEYLYIDERRLDSYFEQISPSPVAYDKVPTWEASITLTSPGAKGTQSRFGRPFTAHEKITQLVEYLEKKRLVYKPANGGTSVAQIPPYTGESKDFTLASFRATRAFIPSNPKLPTFKGLGLWIASFIFSPSFLSDTLTRGSEVILFLLEDFQGKDEPQPGSSVGTAYTNLILLIEGLRKSTDLSDTTSRELSDMARTVPYEDPITFLSEFLGAEIGTERSIRCLFRVREQVIDVSGGGVFGYPIFVAAAGTETLLPTVPQLDAEDRRR